MGNQGLPFQDLFVKQVPVYTRQLESVRKGQK